MLDNYWSVATEDIMSEWSWGAPLPCIWSRNTLRTFCSEWFGPSGRIVATLRSSIVHTSRSSYGPWSNWQTLCDAATSCGFFFCSYDVPGFVGHDFCHLYHFSSIRDCFVLKTSILDWQLLLRLALIWNECTINPDACTNLHPHRD